VIGAAEFAQLVGAYLGLFALIRGWCLVRRWMH